jgi:hypothetical protein
MATASVVGAASGSRDYSGRSTIRRPSTFASVSSTSMTSTTRTFWGAVEVDLVAGLEPIVVAGLASVAAVFPVELVGGHGRPPRVVFTDWGRRHLGAYPTGSFYKPPHVVAERVAAE